MFCGTESPLSDPFASVPETDPLDTQQLTQSESSDDEPNAKRTKLEYNSPSLNLKVYQIPSFNKPKSEFTIYPTHPSALPKFVNNPLNLANPLALNAYMQKSFDNQGRHSLPNLFKPQNLLRPPTISVQSLNKSLCHSETVRYKKNGEVAKKRGPPKGYKRKPKLDNNMSAIQNLTNTLIMQAQNTILTNLLKTSPALLQKNLALLPPGLTITPQFTSPPQVKVPKGTELVELNLDPADWFPEEPYKMIFSRKKNPKWKDFPYRCEHCFKGYRVLPTLLAHSAERHGTVPKEFAIPCPCCPHVSTRRKHHKKHLETHAAKKGKLFCVYCIPIEEPTELYNKAAEKFPCDKFPQYWYASEESLRLHKKRKHPYAAMFNYNWHGGWTDTLANS